MVISVAAIPVNTVGATHAVIETVTFQRLAAAQQARAFRVAVSRYSAERCRDGS
ncbi:hypothetical protein MJ572_01640 [Escherichia coli]|nr:hypothetical protein MJ572_01640 [Escherichia coli]